MPAGFAGNQAAYPQAFKGGHSLLAFGTTEVVPYPHPLPNTLCS
jgi:hypothetical protein